MSAGGRGAPRHPKRPITERGAAVPEPRPTLVDVATGTQFPLADGVMMGRDPSCDLQLAGAGVAPFHAGVRQEEEGWAIRRLSPVAELTLDEQPFDRLLLQEGQELKIAGHTFAVTIQVDAETARVVRYVTKLTERFERDTLSIRKEKNSLARRRQAFEEEMARRKQENADEERRLRQARQEWTRLRQKLARELTQAQVRLATERAAHLSERERWQRQVEAERKLLLEERNAWESQRLEQPERLARADEARERSERTALKRSLRLEERLRRRQRRAERDRQFAEAALKEASFKHESLREFERKVHKDQEKAKVLIAGMFESARQSRDRAEVQELEAQRRMGLVERRAIIAETEREASGQLLRALASRGEVKRAELAQTAEEVQRNELTITYQKRTIDDLRKDLTVASGKNAGDVLEQARRQMEELASERRELREREDRAASRELSLREETQTLDSVAGGLEEVTLTIEHFCAESESIVEKMRDVEAHLGAQASEEAIVADLSRRLREALEDRSQALETELRRELDDRKHQLQLRGIELNRRVFDLAGRRARLLNEMTAWEERRRHSDLELRHQRLDVERHRNQLRQEHAVMLRQLEQQRTLLAEETKSCEHRLGQLARLESHMARLAAETQRQHRRALQERIEAEELRARLFEDPRGRQGVERLRKRLDCETTLAKQFAATRRNSLAIIVERLEAEWSRLAGERRTFETLGRENAHLRGRLRQYAASLRQAHEELLAGARRWRGERSEYLETIGRLRDEMEQLASTMIDPNEVAPASKQLRRAA
ncbi:hypothetical protein Pan216_17460 [Planctomycetes bacterium Pan216]|uniref:FHA domain-containing protein n=1 Tax=Kolteria novifilia TaxID=2527975 RepID=A0A518B1N7_9BACT|nr:hypothetical protein Pan216_17460 [Planctomycetes bacterium Pan216]